MSHSYAPDFRRPAISGTVLALPVAVVATAVLLIWGVVYLTGSPARTAGAYTSIAVPANQALSTELASFARHSHHRILVAESDLAQEQRTLASFDGQLSQMTFPGAANDSAAALLTADQHLAKVLRQQAQSSNLRQLRSFSLQVQSAASAVQAQARAIRAELGLPGAGPPDTSGPRF